MGSCNSTTNCNPCGPDFNAINQLATQTAAYARQANTYSVDAANSAQNAENSWLEFNALYLGAFATPPLPPLQIGALYWNSASNQLFTWSGSVWVLTGFNEFTNFLSTGSSSPRNLVSRTADIVNVKDFGAFDDGSNATATTAAIQSALTYAAANNRVVLIPGGIFSINAVLIANVRVIFEGVLKCGYDPSVAGIRLRSQPIKITDYFMQYCNGVYASVNAQGGSGGDLNMGKAALQAAVNEWTSNRTYHTLDLEGRRVGLNDTVFIDADLDASPSDFDKRKYFSNGKITAFPAMAGSNKAMIELISSSGTKRNEYMSFSNIAFEGAGNASGLRCLNEYYGLIFNNCFGRDPENFLLYFNAPSGGSGSDVIINSCHFIGLATGRTARGLVYNGGDLQICNSIFAYHEVNVDIIGGSQSLISNCHFYGTADNGTDRRMPNVRTTDTRWLTINGCYFDGGPLQLKNTDTSGGSVGWTTVVGCFFITGRPPGYSFVEVETADASTVIQKLQISLNKFYQREGPSQLITNPFQVYGAGISSVVGANDDNHIQDNEFLYVSEQSSEVLRIFSLTASTSDTETPPISRSPFGIKFARIKWFVPEFNANPGGLWFTGSNPTWTVNTGNSVTGTVRTLFTINDAPTNP
jgi:hypothetical protein